MKTEAILEFQKSHRDYFNDPLGTDGMIGAETAWSMMVEDLPRLRRNIIGVGMSEFGKHIVESPPNSNRGPEIDKYLDLCKIDRGNRWCAAFVSWVYRNAGIDIAPNAGVIAFSGQLTKVGLEKVLPGDCFFYIRGDAHHIGLILYTDYVSAIMTLEGNCDNCLAVRERSINGLSFGAPPLPTVKMKFPNNLKLAGGSVT